jgi:hypothetical protein
MNAVKALSIPACFSWQKLPFLLLAGLLLRPSP